MEIRSVYILLFVLFLCRAEMGLAQLEVRSINRTGIKNNPSSNARVSVQRDTISLPFWDDFSGSSLVTDSTLWEINTGALINTSLGQWAPTVNVLSFDGVNASGSPHNPDGVNSEIIDQIISQPIDLEAVTLDKRDSVWFSFYWNMGKLGEVPEQKDSLKVEFLDKDGHWHIEYELIGIEDSLFDSFKKVFIQIDQDKYFHSGFQFKFVASGNSLGPYDVWHIDYVYLNQDRHNGTESLLDRATTGPPASVFKEYSMIPYDLLFSFPDTIYQDIAFDFSTLENRVTGVEYIYKLTSLNYPNTDSSAINAVLINDNVKDGNFTLPGLGRNTNFYPALDHSYFSGFDSLFVETELIFSSTGDSYFIKSIDGPEGSEVETYLINEEYNYRKNDTVRSYFEIHETLAYDDGSAEYAAGLNKNESEFAIYFKIPAADTLTSIDIHFPQFSRPPATGISPAGERILLKILKDLSGEASSELRSQEFIIPGGSLPNRLDRFTFDSPAIVSGEFYIGLEQLTNEYIGIGLDNNSTLGKSKIFVKTEDVWLPNNKVEGILMFRPVFEDSDYVVTEVKELVKDISVFPNPSKERLNIRGTFDQYFLMDLSGKIVQSGKEKVIIVDQFESGIYLLKFIIGDAVISEKVIIQH